MSSNLAIKFKKSLARLTKKKEGDDKLLISEMKEDINIYPMESKRIIKSMEEDMQRAQRHMKGAQHH